MKIRRPRSRFDRDYVRSGERRRRLGTAMFVVSLVMFAYALGVMLL